MKKPVKILLTILCALLPMMIISTMRSNGNTLGGIPMLIITLPIFWGIPAIWKKPKKQEESPPEEVPLEAPQPLTTPEPKPTPAEIEQAPQSKEAKPDVEPAIKAKVRGSTIAIICLSAAVLFMGGIILGKSWTPAPPVAPISTLPPIPTPAPRPTPVPTPDTTTSKAFRVGELQQNDWPARYVSSTYSHTIHLPSCVLARDIVLQNAEWWVDIDTPLYTPCVLCIAIDSRPAVGNTPYYTLNYQEGYFVGSVNSDKYHVPSCQFAKRIYSYNQVWWDSTEEARAAGYSPCSVCIP